MKFNNQANRRLLGELGIVDERENLKSLSFLKAFKTTLKSRIH
jgi:hypothetical protein